MVEEMKIRDGYKKTEVGVIPEDWEVVNLIEISNLIGDGIHTTPKYVSNSETYFINGNNLINGKIKIFKETKCINKIEYEKHKKNLNNNTILMSINGTIGNLAFYNNEKIILGKSASYININKGANKKYIFYQLQMESINKFYENKLTGTTIRNLSLKTIRETPILLPPLKEQKAIATVLSDMDDLIESTQKLIDKKKKMKQGTIQELLTGKKRLDGFSAEWITKNLEKLFNFKQGVQCSVLKQRVLKEEGLVRFIRIVDLTKNDELPRYIKDPGLEHHVSNDDLFMIRYGEPGIVGYDFEGVIANNLFHLNPKIVIYNKFFYYLLTYMKKEIAQLSSSTTMAALNFESLKLLNIKTPKDIKEQKAIAQILSDMDSEIELQQQKLEKYKTIKKGMMQELLTGRIRLI
ncbi:restriction endonuclease subunit S [Senegalia sp. (in: firmicutes)]|uniref:restriction endonuclease subunit S n=1 Tax=Senegalia sp. (in: firmicutes) TaxID=1924098 RepID=UPI003F9643DD